MQHFKCSQCKFNYPASRSTLGCPYCEKISKSRFKLDSLIDINVSHNSRSLFNTAMWLLISILELCIFIEYVHMLGGIQRILSIGRGPAAAAQMILIGGALLLSGFSWTGSKGIRPVGKFISIVAFSFGCSFFFPWIPVLGALNPYTSPFGIVGLVMPFIIGFVAMIAASSDSEGKQLPDSIQDLAASETKKY
jgi:hypothetical protein